MKTVQTEDIWMDDGWIGEREDGVRMGGRCTSEGRTDKQMPFVPGRGNTEE